MFFNGNHRLDWPQAGQFGFGGRVSFFAFAVGPRYIIYETFFYQRY